MNEDTDRKAESDIEKGLASQKADAIGLWIMFAVINGFFAFAFFLDSKITSAFFR